MSATYNKPNRAPKKNRPRYTEARKKQWKRRGIVLAVVVAITSYGAYAYTVKKDNEKANQVQVEQTIKQDHEQVAQLPKPPKTLWNYASLLDNEVVPIHYVKQYDLPSTPYLMQCGSYQTVGQAEYRKAQLALAGFTSQIRLTDTNSGMWYRIILGPYSTQRHGGQARAEMHRLGIENCAVWRWIY